MAKKAQPTLLGRVLKYITDSRNYAGMGGSTKAGKQLKFNDVLGQMSKVPVNTSADAQLDEITRMAVVCSWVYSDIKLIADRASSYDWFTVEQQMDDEELDPVKDHPFLELFRRPNPIMSGSYLKRYILWWFCLYGNAYLYFVVGKEGIKEIWPLPTNQVVPDPTTLRPSTVDDRMIIDYIYTVNGMRYSLSGEYVVHFRTANIFDYWVGLSPLSALQMPVRTDFSQSYWLDTFFGKENAIPAAIISVSEEVNDADFDMVRNDLMEQFGGGRKTAITRAGDISVEVIQQAISELRVLEGREFNRQEIDRIYGIPEGMITGGLSGDSRLAAEISFARNALQPILDIFVDDLHRAFAPYITLGLSEDSATKAIATAKGKKAPQDPKETDDPTDAVEYVLKAIDVVPQDKALDLADYQAYGQDRTINENRKLHDDDELTFEGDLKELQPLVDQVPMALMAFVAPVVVQKWQSKFAPPPEQGNPFASLFGGAPTPPPLQDPNQMGNDAQANAGQPGQGKPNQQDKQDGQPGYRDSGQKPPEVVQEQMAFKASPEEAETMRVIFGMRGNQVPAVKMYVNGDGPHDELE